MGKNIEIVSTKRSDDWIAWIKDQHGFWEQGKTEAEAVGKVFIRWHQEKEIENKIELIHARLWAHCVSQHAAIISPDTSTGDLNDYHDHEHEGPCTIRNHDQEDRSFSLNKLGRVLSDSER